MADKNLHALDQGFEMIEQKPVQLTGCMQEVFVNDFNENWRNPVSSGEASVYYAKAT